MLKKRPWSKFTIKEEVRVYDLNPNFKNKRLRIDWVIYELGICIEIQGPHHHKPLRYGGSQGEAESRFLKFCANDDVKLKAIEQAGFKMIYIDWDKIPTARKWKKLLLGK